MTSAPIPGEVTDIGMPAPDLVRLYTLLLKTRLFDERMRRLFKQGRFAGTYFSQVGQEATTVGPGFALREDDFCAGQHRELGLSISKGVPLRALLSHIYSRADAPCKGKSHPCHYGYAPKNLMIPASTVAGQSPLAVGAALAFKIRAEDRIAVSYTGEGGTAQGAWHEALNFAAVWKLPLVFVVQNNLWAESVPTHLTSALTDYSDRGKGHGIPGVSVDGNDATLAHKTAKEAFERARRGEGPTVIEFKTYRWYGHSEIDPADYRRPEELEEWKQRDPVPRFERFLFRTGVLDEAKKEAIVAEIDADIQDAIEHAESTPYAPPEEALNDVYSWPGWVPEETEA